MFDVALENSFDFFSEEYLQLFARSSATAFQHPLWLDRLYRRLAPAVKAEPLIMTARRRDDGRLAMLLPLMRRRQGPLRVIEFADLQVSGYVAPVCDAAAFAQLASDQAVRDGVRACLESYDVLRLKKICDAAPPLEQLFAGSERSLLDMSAYSVPLYEPFEQWREDNLEPSYRRELDRKRRQLNRRGAVRLECSSDPQFVEGTFRSIREYRADRFGSSDLLQDQRYFDFYADVALRGSDCGFSRTYRMSIDGQSIGGVWGLEHKRQFLVLLVGSDLANHKNRSIGALAFEDVAQDCLARQNLLLDFTIGDEAYKLLFGARPSNLWTVSAGGTPPGKLANFVAQKTPWAVKAAKSLVIGRRRAVPSGPPKGDGSRGQDRPTTPAEGP